MLNAIHPIDGEKTDLAIQNFTGSDADSFCFERQASFLSKKDPLLDGVLTVWEVDCDGLRGAKLP